MKKYVLLIIAIVSVTISAAQCDPAEKDLTATKTPITLLGTYHFDNPNQDQFNVHSDNIFSEKRQRELEELVKQLAAFKPTHIALEFNKNDSALDTRYQQYLKGNYQLDASEREQIGFRVARLLGHQHIYPVDEPSIQVNFEPGELANQFSCLLNKLSNHGQKIMTDINSWVAQKPVGEVLSQLNSPELDKLNIDLYYRYLLPISNDEKQPGLESVLNWYKRNLIIFKNIKELPGNGKEEKKIMVIFGQGHTAMLKQFLAYSNEFNLVDIQQFLPK